ncbi:MAG TPA: tetratricopeptide repeat protein, partial [Vicinamibacterales bacterium]|nr:tetratricopeptide repeat protein [Vicinamibacterales bacterium]
EQVRGETLDARTDVFSFGLVLYEAATGLPPFSGATSGVISEAILNRTPRAVNEVNAAVPSGIEAVIAKAIEKDRQLRYQSIADLKADLERLARGLTPSATVRAEPPAAKTLKRWLAAALLAIVAIAAGLSFVWRPFSASKTIDSLAVLPFSNASGNADADYLSEGLAESLIDQLSRLRTLKVTSRGAAFRFKGRESDLTAIRHDLNVRAIVTGRVVLRGDSVSINAELVDATDGHQVWGEHYNQKLSDVLSIQDEIAKRIADSLGTQLSGDDERRMMKRNTNNAEAYQLYLKGMYHTAKFSKAEMDAGMAYFKQAIELDPGYALAYHGLAYHAALAEDWIVDAREVMPMAKDAAQKAIRIDDTLADAHADLAFNYCTYEWNWAAGEQEITRALQIDPANVYSKESEAWCRVPMGQMKQAIQALEEAVRKDALSEEYVSLLGMFRYLDRQFDTAAEPIKKSIELEPNYWPGYSYLGHLYARTKRYADAEAAFKKAIAIDATVGEPVSGLGITYALEGKTADARAIADRLQHWPTYVSAYNIATVYTALGDRDAAFTWLNKAVDTRSWLLTWLNVDPDLDGLRADPRFATLVQRVGVAPTR